MKLFKSLKGHPLYSVFTGACPVCQEESMYVDANPYKISRLFNMHERCSNCNTKYKIEPSFFFGAMYVSYGVGICFATPAFILSHWIFNLSLLTSFLVIVGVLFMLLPVIIRLSRNIWVNFFFSYQEKYKKVN